MLWSYDLTAKLKLNAILAI